LSLRSTSSAHTRTFSLCSPSMILPGIAKSTDCRSLQL
jgi:hypothetical protein